MAILLSLVVLHNAAGQEITVNSKEVTILRSPMQGRHLSPKARCAIFFSDGKFASVTETCEAVRQLFEKPDSAR
jgi:hypothetical protein